MSLLLIWNRFGALRILQRCAASDCSKSESLYSSLVAFFQFASPARGFGCAPGRVDFIGQCACGVGSV